MVVVGVIRHFGADVEHHHLVGRIVWGVGLSFEVVLQVHWLASKWWEVNHNLPTFSQRNPEVSCPHWVISAARVGSHDEERDVVGVVILAYVKIGDEIEPESTADWSVKKAKTVFSGLYIEKWPRLTVTRRTVSIILPNDHSETYTWIPSPKRLWVLPAGETNPPFAWYCFDAKARRISYWPNGSPCPGSMTSVRRQKPAWPK